MFRSFKNLVLDALMCQYSCSGYARSLLLSYSENSYINVFEVQHTRDRNTTGEDRVYLSSICEKVNPSACLAHDEHNSSNDVISKSEFF